MRSYQPDIYLEVDSRVSLYAGSGLFTALADLYTGQKRKTFIHNSPWLQGVLWCLERENEILLLQRRTIITPHSLPQKPDRITHGGGGGGVVTLEKINHRTLEWEQRRRQ